MDCMVWSVTFFLAIAGGEPIGECEEYRTWVVEVVSTTENGIDEAHDCDIDGEERFLRPCLVVVRGRIDFVAELAVLIKARDMLESDRVDVSLLC